MIYQVYGQNKLFDSIDKARAEAYKEGIRTGDNHTSVYRRTSKGDFVVAGFVEVPHHLDGRHMDLAYWIPVKFKKGGMFGVRGAKKRMSKKGKIL